MKKYRFVSIALAAALFFTGCETQERGTAPGSSEVTSSSENSPSPEDTSESSAPEDSAVPSSVPGENPDGIVPSADLFSERDLKQTAELSDAQRLTVGTGKNISITEEGVYRISGTASDCTITVNAPKDAKVQLVLDGVNISNNDLPAVYVTEADKVFVTTTENQNTLSASGEITMDGESNIDAVIFSKSDLILNGTGTLDITSDANAVAAKDDLKITGGSYQIKAAADGFEANDSIAIAGGDFEVNAAKNAFQCKNDASADVGYIYIANGNFTLNAENDAIQGITAVQIDGGTFEIAAVEAVEATYVQINGGKISINASDDGINASEKCTFYDITVEINGGELTIVMGPGDTDAVDSNGSIYVNGGNIDITAQMSSFDYEQTAEYNGGTITINGNQVDEIPQSMGGGPGGRGGHHNGHFNGFDHGSL